MATYKEIQNYISSKYNVVVQTCWIAEMKEKHGLTTRIAPNRISFESRVKPCPEDKIELISEAFKHFEMI